MKKYQVKIPLTDLLADGYQITEDELVYVAKAYLNSYNKIQKSKNLSKAYITRLIPGEDRTYGIHFGKPTNFGGYAWVKEEDIYIERNVILAGKSSHRDRKIKRRITDLKHKLDDLKELLDISSGTDRTKFDTARTMAMDEIKFLEGLLTFSA